MNGQPRTGLWAYCNDSLWFATGPGHAHGTAATAEELHELLERFRDAWFDL